MEWRLVPAAVFLATIQRLGNTEDMTSEGKITAAANRDLGLEISEARFRENFYYRLCSDIIHTPTLFEQLQNPPDELVNLILFITRGGMNEDAEVLAKEVSVWTDKNLDADYPWPGNFRELEQCVRNIIMRTEYRPHRQAHSGARIEYAESIKSGALTPEELLSYYWSIHRPTATKQPPIGPRPQKRKSEGRPGIAEKAARCFALNCSRPNPSPIFNETCDIALLVKPVGR